MSGPSIHHSPGFSFAPGLTKGRGEGTIAASCKQRSTLPPSLGHQKSVMIIRCCTFTMGYPSSYAPWAIE